MPRDPWGLQQRDKPSPPRPEGPARTPRKHEKSTERPRHDALYQYTGPGRFVESAPSSAPPTIPPACDKFHWKVIGTAAPGQEFVRDRRTGAYVEKPITT